MTISKNRRSWDIILLLLADLDEYDHNLLSSILERCNIISTEYIEGNGGLYNVLTSEEQIQSDVAYEREQRYEKAGYILPTNASAFLSLARSSDFTKLTNAVWYDSLIQSYFKQFNETSKFDRISAVNKDLDLSKAGRLFEDLDIFYQLLIDAKIVSEHQGPLLKFDSNDSLKSHKYQLIYSVFAYANNSDLKLFDRSMIEINYLANTLLSGCSFLGRTLHVNEAVEAVLATCNLGLEHIVKSRFNQDDNSYGNNGLESYVLKNYDIIRIFQNGWNILFHEVVLYSSHYLLELLPKCDSRDSWIKSELGGVVNCLKTSIKSGKPWEIREKLDILELVMNQPEVSQLKQLVDELPSICMDLNKFPNISLLKHSSFISSYDEIDKIHIFLNALKYEVK